MSVLQTKVMVRSIGFTYFLPWGLGPFIWLLASDPRACRLLVCDFIYDIFYCAFSKLI